MGDLHASDGTRLRWRRLDEHVDAHADAVLLVHGWMVSSRVWEAVARLLPGLRLVAVELRGAAGTPCDAATLSLPRHADDVLAIADDAGLDHFDLVGHSMGGQVAQLVAAAAPARVRSLALLNPVPLAGLPLPPEADALFHAAGGDAGRLGTILDLACKQLPAPAHAALVADALRIAPDVIAAGVDVFTRGADANLAAITAPTLVVATDDPFLPPAFLQEAVVARIPGARLEILHGPGHYPQVEAPEDTARLLAAAWRRRQ